MENKPRNSILRLLSEPSFDFAPYFEKAVIQWLERNMSDFLEEAPEACKFFINDEDYQTLVAQYIKVDQSNEKLIANFMRAFTLNWQSTAALEYLVPKLIEAKLTSLIMNCVPTLKTSGSPRLKDLFKAMSDDDIRTLVTDLDWSQLRWDGDVRCALIARMPEDLLEKADPRYWSWYTNPSEKSQAVVALARRWPLNDIANFMQKFAYQYSDLSCMHCGEKTAKSKPGYTLHRKSCDPDNAHPSILQVVAERAR